MELRQSSLQKMDVLFAQLEAIVIQVSAQLLLRAVLQEMNALKEQNWK